ncbi:F0F1 ATP synthase subunit B [Thorsellia anophelis]|uniref:ATP synthase subunit b n=1 Tax=Thorsellia anophelis DSM 18579 TaxID=1123402 RepID=A0A1I0DPN0_9GAMM|nr:F0F1 ATP synthase subunit B [Thorsellia anophelis]SET34096.1 ATP synthase F0 subcomplex B subunit [Thorsellia anophelis DSM 18579]
MDINLTILGQAICFFLFVLFCMKFVWPPIIGAIEKRQKEIADGLASAQQGKKEMEQAKADVNDQINKAKAEALVIVEQANKRRAQIIDQARLEAEDERSKILQQAKAEVEAERAKAKDELRKQVARLAIAGAEKIIERSIDESANSDIVDKLVAEL